MIDSRVHTPSGAAVSRSPSYIEIEPTLIVERTRRYSIKLGTCRYVAVGANVSSAINQMRVTLSIWR